MSFGSALTSLLWFIAILALIPAALWLLKRGCAGGGAARGLLRTVAVLPLSPSQRLVTVEVGHGESRRWLVLGVTGQQIATLHEMAPQDESATLPPQAAAPFAQLLAQLQGKDKGEDRDAR
jgi:flagellar protein FliO/FliZ